MAAPGDRVIGRCRSGRSVGREVCTCVHNNPINHIDPLGLIVQQQWDQATANLIDRGGFWNNVAAYGIHFGSTALNFASLGSFSKNDRLADLNLAGKISDGQFKAGVAINAGVAGASLAVGGGSGALVGRAASGVSSLVLQGAMVGGAAGFSASATDVAGTRAGYAAVGLQYEQGVGDDAKQILLGTAGGALVGGAGGLGARLEWMRANSYTKGKWGENLARSQLLGEKNTVLGEQITIDTSTGTVIPDFAVQSPEGNLRFVDAKAGPTAAVRQPQAAGYRALQQQGGTARGANAVDAKLAPPSGTGSVPATPVEILRYPAGTYPGGAPPPPIPAVIRQDNE